MNPKNNTATFRLAITMAGAVSAGCYTAGVMDYLFEILDLWEKAKRGEVTELQPYQNKIPDHQVVIEAMGGTSAGGMTTTMAAIYALKGEINPVKEPGAVDEVKNNILYDSWVLMDDDNKADPRPLFEKVWDDADLEDGTFRSLLNSKFVDNIADRVFAADQNADILKSTQGLPAYISPDLQLLYSHCFLRGIPLDVSFETTISKTGRKSVIPNHTTFEHYIVTQYHLNKGIKPDPDKYLWLNPYDKPYADILKLATKATGAFPVGLIYREFATEQLHEGYLKTAMKRVITGEFGKTDPDPDKKIQLKYLPKNYSSFTVDGGVINNEPYREVLSILHDRYGGVTSEGYHGYGVIMIDPFPDRAQLTKSYTKPNDVLDVAQNIIGVLTDQSRIKRREMLDADTSKYFRSIIFPRKWKTDKNKKPTGQPGTIACAAAMAFGGFLDICFRQHDFFLGRNNARNFFRYYFSFPYYKDEKDASKDDIHPIHRNWTHEMIEAFKIVKNGTVFLPIIPDLNILIEKDKSELKEPYDYDIPETPLYDPKKLFVLRKKIRRRFRKILDIVQHRDFSEAIRETKTKELNKLPEKQRKELQKKESESEKKLALANEWIRREYSPGLLSRLGSMLGSPFKALGIWLGKYISAKIMTQKIELAILKDLASQGLLKAPEEVTKPKTLLQWFYRLYRYIF